MNAKNLPWFGNLWIVVIVKSYANKQAGSWLAAQEYKQPIRSQDSKYWHNFWHDYNLQIPTPKTLILPNFATIESEMYPPVKTPVLPPRMQHTVNQYPMSLPYTAGHMSAP